MALALTPLPTGVGTWLWAEVGREPLCPVALPGTLHESPGDRTFSGLVRELHRMCYWSLGGARECWCMALSGVVLTLGLFLRPALQGGSLCCTLSLGTNTLIPSRTTLGFGQPCIPSRHTSPHTDNLCSALQSGWEPVRSAETLMGLWGRVKGDGTSQRCTIPGCCPNMFLDFMSPPELY